MNLYLVASILLSNLPHLIEIGDQKETEVKESWPLKEQITSR